MSQLKKNYELKAAARGHLEGNYSKSALIIVAFFICSILINLIPTSTGPKASISGYLLVVMCSTIITTIPLLLKAGLYHFFIKMCCKTNFDVKDVFCAFEINGTRNFALAIIIVLIENVILLPGGILFYLYIEGNSGYLPSTIIALVIGFIVYLLFEISISQILFLIFDFPDKTVKEIIALALYLIRGNEIKYFTLLLSFVPLELLGLLTCGIGLLWVFPYKYASLACFYLDLTKNISSNP